MYCRKETYYVYGCGDDFMEGCWHETDNIDDAVETCNDFADEYGGQWVVVTSPPNDKREGVFSWPSDSVLYLFDNLIGEIDE